jgi:hypothetical protein
VALQACCARGVAKAAGAASSSSQQHWKRAATSCRLYPWDLHQMPAQAAVEVMVCEGLLSWAVAICRVGCSGVCAEQGCPAPANTQPLVTNMWVGGWVGGWGCDHAVSLCLWAL